MPGLRHLRADHNLVAVVIGEWHAGDVSGKHRRKWSGWPAGGWGARFARYGRVCRSSLNAAPMRSRQ
jgi:hypothetical protein